MTKGLYSRKSKPTRGKKKNGSLYFSMIVSSPLPCSQHLSLRDLLAQIDAFAFVIVGYVLFRKIRKIKYRALWIPGANKRAVRGKRQELQKV